MRLRGQHGFTLLELAMVVVVSGLMLGYVVKTTQSVNRQDCYVETKQKLLTIRASVERFARKNDRLPLPAARNIGPESPFYGRESSGANIDQIGAGATGVSFGALPFQALGLTTDYAGDCWGNKFTYIVTTPLTTNASSGGYLDTTVAGNIAVKTTTAVTMNAAAAYAVISHGEDALGAVKLGYTAANGANTPPYAGHGWCSGVSTLATMNCRASAAEVADGSFNNGQDAGAAYYDDLVITAGRPLLLPTTTSNAFCWGANANGRIGNGTTTSSPKATVVSGTNIYSAIASNNDFTCALTTEGIPYCWGMNNFGQLGNGGTTASNTPQAVTLPVGVTYFKSIAVGSESACGIGNDNLAYCWGKNSQGQMGVLTGYGSHLVPEAVFRPGGVASYTAISTGTTHTCAIANTGDVYCMGVNDYGKIGNGTTGGAYGTPELVTRPGAVSSFTSIAAGISHTCAIANTGDAYCWGQGDSYGELGNGLGSNSNIPVVVTRPGGVNKFTKITASHHLSCAIADNGQAYCWGGAWTNVGQIGDGNNLNRVLPRLVTMPAGVTSFLDIRAQLGDASVCATGNDFVTYCWGDNSADKLGDGTSTDHNVPTAVLGSSGGINLGTIGNGRCALRPLPAIGWGMNYNGVVGDGTAVKTNSPKYSWPTSQPDLYFTYIAGGNTRCGIGNTGALYCWGANNYGQIGDNSTTARTTPVLISPPADVTAWKAVNTAFSVRTCAIASGGPNNDKMYCWGSRWGDASQYVPNLIATGCPGNTVSSMHAQQYSIEAICTDGITTYEERDGGIAMPALPANTTRIYQIARSYYEICILADNSVDGPGQIYCYGTNYANNVIGDGSALGTGNAGFARVTPPAAPFTKFTSLSNMTGALDGATGFCGLGDDQWVYCWGNGVGTGTDAAGVTPALVPTAVIAPTGVTKFLNLRGNEGYGEYTTALGNDGKTYGWGTYYYDNDWPSGWSIVWHRPTLMPVPVGATGYRGIGAGNAELVY